MFSPRISGIACTDTKGHLFFTHEDSPRHHLVSRLPTVPDWVSDVDLTLLKRFIISRKLYREIVVIGENTLKEAKILFSKEKPALYMIAGKEQVQLLEVSGGGSSIVAYADYDASSPQQALRLIALKEAFKRRANIMVLGGRSVYEAFSGYYDNFVHCTVKAPNPILQEHGEPEVCHNNSIGSATPVRSVKNPIYEGITFGSAINVKTLLNGSKTMTLHGFKKDLISKVLVDEDAYLAIEYIIA